MTKATIDPYDHLKIVVDPDGTLIRYGQIPVVPSSMDGDYFPGQNVITKDVPLNEEKKTWIRIFRPFKLPSNDDSVARLPILIYFHGGGLIQYSAGTIFCHSLCGRFATQLPSIVVSIDYRLAPENRLPAAYEDGEEAVLWVKKQALAEYSESEQWLREYGDFSRCYLIGCSSGATVAYYTGLRCVDLDLEPVRIAGLILNQPCFGGVKRTKSELKYHDDEIMPLPAADLLWELALPEGADRDHELCNPLTKGAYNDKVSKLPSCLVRGYGGDVTTDRQMELVRMLVGRGVKVVARFEDDGFYGIDLVDARRALATMHIAKEFISVGN